MRDVLICIRRKKVCKKRKVVLNLSLRRLGLEPDFEGVYVGLDWLKTRIEVYYGCKVKEIEVDENVDEIGIWVHFENDTLPFGAIKNEVLGEDIFIRLTEYGPLEIIWEKGL